MKISAIKQIICKFDAFYSSWIKIPEKLKTEATAFKFPDVKAMIEQVDTKQ